MKTALVCDQGFKDLEMEPRCKTWTLGSPESLENTIILGINQCRPDEEGDYKCTLTNSHGVAEFDFKFFVTVEGGLDFRAMLMKRKRPQRTAVVAKRIEWLETPEDVRVQEKKADRVVFAARLSDPKQKGKWYFSNRVIFFY